MLKNILNLEGAQELNGTEQKNVSGGLLSLKPWCQCGGDSACCGNGPGQCGTGHCSGGYLSGGVCVCC
ncbi:MAG: hypothetical protein AAF985_03055 [Bacteroidota bacterium]